MKSEHAIAGRALGGHTGVVSEADTGEKLSHMTVHPAMHKGKEAYVVHHHKSEHEMPHEGEKHIVSSMHALKQHIEEHAPSMHGMPEGGDGAMEEAIE